MTSWNAAPPNLVRKRCIPPHKVAEAADVVVIAIKPYQIEAVIHRSLTSWRSQTPSSCPLRQAGI